MENEIVSNNQTNVSRNLTSKKTLILIIVVAIVAFLFWLFASNPSIGKAQLAWKANTEIDLAGYKIYYGLSPRKSACPPDEYTNKVDAGNATSYSVANLSNGATYYFSLTSYDALSNESCFSLELSKTTEKIKPIETAKANLKKLFRQD